MVESVERSDAVGPRQTRKHLPARAQMLVHVFALALLAGAVKIAGAAKSAMSARFFGLSTELDCYLVAFALASFACEAISGSVTAALIPMLVKASAGGNANQLREGYGRILYPACTVLALAGVLLSLTDRVAYKLLASGFSPASLALTHKLFLIMLPMFPATAVIAVWRALLNSEGTFGLAAAAPVLTPIAILGALVLGVHNLGIYSLGIGTSAGAAGELCILAVGIRRRQYRLFPTSTFRPPEHWLRSEYFPLLATNLVSGSRNAVDQAFAATLGAGAVSALNLGTRLVTVLTTLGPATVSTVLLPKLSRFAASKNWRRLRGEARSAALLWSAIGCLISVVAIGLSRPLAYVAFQQGGPLKLNVSLLGHVQALSFTQLPFAFLSAILTRAALSAGLNRKLMFVSVTAALANVGLDLLCAKKLGVAGIPFATTLVYAMTSALLIGVLRQKRS
jgi:putative peptidoglycan lipid II flippase